MITHTMKHLLSLRTDAENQQALGLIERSAMVILGGLPRGEMPHENGRPCARLPDLVPGRTGTVYADWLAAQGSPAFTAGIRTATLDPFHGYANAIRDQLPEAITVLDAFHVVKLAGQVVDEVRRRVQQDTLGHRGRAGDPLYGIRRTSQIGVEHLTEKQIRRLNAKLDAGDPHHEVTLACHCYQKLRAVYRARPERGRQLVAEVLAAFPTCPIWQPVLRGGADTAMSADHAHFTGSDSPAGSVEDEAAIDHTSGDGVQLEVVLPRVGAQ